MLRKAQRRTKMSVPAKKRVGIRGYVSPQPRTPVVKRPKTPLDDEIMKRAIDRLPAGKRSKEPAHASH